MREGERARERERDREREKQRERERHREREKQRERERAKTPLSTEDKKLSWERPVTIGLEEVVTYGRSLVNF